jgi:hypothetical protein
MIASTEKMRQRAIYVNVKPKRKEVETPMEIGEEEPKTILTAAEHFLKTVRYIAEKLPEEEKSNLKKLFSKIPKKDWRTGEITTDWLSEVIKKTS